MRKEAFFLVEPARNDYIKPMGTIEIAQTLEIIAAKIEQLDSAQFALVSITLDFEQAGRREIRYQDLIDASIYSYLEHLRPLVRKTDSVFLLQHTFYFVLPGANLQGGEIVQERLWNALLWHSNNTFDDSYLRPYRVTIGYSATPVPFINVDQCIDAACEVKREFDVRPEKIVCKTEKLKDAELPEMARKLGVPYVSCLPRKLPARIQRLVDPELAQELRCFPIGRDRDILTVAMLNPQDRNVVERLRKETGLDIFPVLTHPQELQTALEQLS